MNTWALLSNWSQDDFQNEPLVSVLEFSGISSWLQFCPSQNRHSFVETLHWFIFVRTVLSDFQLMLLFSWDAFFFSFLFFFIVLFLFFSFFYYFTTRLRTWTLFKMNKFFFLFFLKKNFKRKGISHWFLFSQGRNSSAQIPVFDPNGLSKYVI